MARRLRRAIGKNTWKHAECHAFVLANLREAKILCRLQGKPEEMKYITEELIALAKDEGGPI